MTQDEFLISRTGHAAGTIAHRVAELLMFGAAEIPPGSEQCNAERLEAAIWGLVSMAALLAGTRVLAVRFDVGLMQQQFDALTADLRRAVARGQVQGPCSLLGAPPARHATAHEVAHALAAYVDAGATGPVPPAASVDDVPTPDPAAALRDPAASTWFLHALEAAMRRDPVDAANDAEVLARILDKHAHKVLTAARAGLNLRAAKAGS